MAGNYPKPSSLIEIAGESGRMNFSQGRITGTRVAEVDWSQLQDAVKYLLGAIVIATGGEEIIYPGDVWPGFPNLVASAVDVKGMGKTSNSEWETIIPHTRARLEVQYTTPQYNSESGGSNGPQADPYIIESLDYACEVLSIPVKLDDGGNTKEVKRHFRIPTIIYNLELPTIKNPNWSLIRDLSGQINSVAVFGGAVGTVLFDGPKLSREVMTDGTYSWKAIYKFIYNKFGWNKQIHPETLEWVSVAALSGGNLPYESGDLRQLWQNIQL